jgi:hypothetical protein
MRLTVVAVALLIVSQSSAAPTAVGIDGRRLLVRGTPYVLRGVIWSPAGRTTNTSASDPNNAAIRRAEFDLWDDTDVPLLADMNVNTVRLMLDPGPNAAGLAVLDRLHAHGIMVVMTVDNGVNDLARIQQVVPFFKNHPAILMWSLGSEWNINRYFGVASSVANAAQRTQTAAALVKSLDPNHPVATSYGDIDINATGMRLADTAHYVNDVCTDVDVWGLNIYRGNSMGALYTQWAGITAKPMFLGEFGTDAFRSVTGSTSAGSVDGVMQSDWNLALWDELFGHLSANVPEAVALGGFVFEFNDEWWKVAPPASQQTGGFGGAQPDGFFNEEYFGVFDIDRNPRLLRDALEDAFDAAYTPPGTHAFRVMSRGENAQEYSSQCGVVWFFRDGAKLYSKQGCSTTGRGMHVAVFDPATGDLQQPIAHFDTWTSRENFCSMNTLLDAVPNGMLILIGVADEAGLTQFPPNDCVVSTHTCRTQFVQRVMAMGSTKVGQYCYQGSWAFAAVKGEGVAREENVSTNGEVSARTTLAGPTRTLSLTSIGDGVVRSVPAGVDCDASCDAELPLGASVALHADPRSGWTFAAWGGACSGATCSIAMSEDRAVTATFNATPGTGLYLVTPCRALDTRDSMPLSANGTRTLELSGVCGIPSTAKAVALNVTVVAPPADGWLTLHPAHLARPLASTINFRTAKTRANNAVAALSPQTELAIYNGGTSAVHVLIDVSGWFE